MPALKEHHTTWTIRFCSYAEKNSTPETDVLKALRIKTWQTVLSPQMLSDAVQGQFPGQHQSE
jgi:hypothetical protein